MHKIFLSASIPDPSRELRFYETSDISAIRDSVTALATIVVPHAHLIWGGHPAITPLLRFVAKGMGVEIQNHITLYQSKFFEHEFPIDNKQFENVIITPSTSDKDSSIAIMRNQMIGDNLFSAGIFIGGMEGVMIEYQIFKYHHPRAATFPIASTGAAAREIFQSTRPNPDERLLSDYAYMSLFRDLLKQFIGTDN